VSESRQEGLKHWEGKKIKKEKGKREECAKEREKLLQEDTDIGSSNGSTNFVVLQKKHGRKGGSVGKLAGMVKVSGREENKMKR